MVPIEETDFSDSTILFQALATLEKVLEKQEDVVVVTRIVSPSKIVLRFARHSDYWVRNISQRLLGHIFAKSKKNLVPNLGLELEEELIPFMYSLMDCLKESLQTEEI